VFKAEPLIAVVDLSGFGDTKVLRVTVSVTGISTAGNVNAKVIN
jgi:hypothetical protein